MRFKYKLRTKTHWGNVDIYRHKLYLAEAEITRLEGAEDELKLLTTFHKISREPNTYLNNPEKHGWYVCKLTDGTYCVLKWYGYMQGSWHRDVTEWMLLEEEK